MILIYLLLRDAAIRHQSDDAHGGNPIADHHHRRWATNNRKSHNEIRFDGLLFSIAVSDVPVDERPEQVAQKRDVRIAGQRYSQLAVALNDGEK